MGGQQTAGFDVVMEFSEKPLQDVLGVALDTSNFLCSLLGFLQLPCEGFAVSVSLDRPTSPVLTPDQTNAVDIQISGGLLVLWRIRIIAGIDVDRSNPVLQSARVNLHDRLYHLSATLGGVPVSTDALADNLRNVVRAIGLPVLLPVTAEPAPTVAPTRLDVQVIDVAGGANAFAVCMTFGGGTPGNLANLTSSAVPAGGDVAVMVGFGYLMRLMEPAIEAAWGSNPVISSTAISPAGSKSTKTTTSTWHNSTSPWWTRRSACAPAWKRAAPATPRARISAAISPST